MQRLSFMLVLVAALLPCAEALAVALGDELILSRLGDPVEVEIEVLQWEGLDMDRMQISAATEQEYAAFRMTWLPVLEALNFNLLGPNLDGEVRLLVSSREALNEPFLELLLVLRWPGGSLLREYVLLFDPPGTLAAPPNLSQAPAAARPVVTAEAPASVVPPPLPAPAAEPARQPEPTIQVEVAPEPVVVREPEVAAEPVVARQPEVVPEPVVVREAQVVPEPAVAAESIARQQPDVRTQAAIEVETITVPASRPAAPTPDSARRSYQVRLGDSLWNIARQFRPAGAGENLFQVLVSLHDLNRGAFINGNISLLKANVAMQLPEAADIARIDAARAEAIFNERWNQGTQPFDVALAGEASPLFAGEEAAAELVPEQATAPVSAPGQELPAADDLVMVANVPTPLRTGAATQAASNAAVDVVVPAQNLAVAPAQQAVATLATFREVPGVGESAEAVGSQSILAPAPESLQQTLQAREQQRIALEQQVEVMRIRMQEAQTVAALFSSSLQQAQQSRAAREQEYLRNSMLLGALVLALAVGLVVAVVQVFRQASQLRAPRVAAAVGIVASTPVPVGTPQAAATQQKHSHERVEPGFHGSQQAAEASLVDTAPQAQEPVKTPAAVRRDSPQDTELFAELENLLADESTRKP